MRRFLTLTVYAGIASSLRVRDPGDTISPALWAGDNALFADYRGASEAQPRALTADFTYNNAGDVTPPGRTFETQKNDTSVILASNGAKVHLTSVDIRKLGYSSNVNEAATSGLNSAVAIDNGSTGTLSHVNITTHNGAPNVFVSGSSSRLYLDNAWLYSSGPGASAVLASGKATAFANHIKAYSGGLRSSIFAGSEPGGALNISNAIARTTGAGSPCFWPVGQINAGNVLCETERSPMLVMDGASLAKISSSSSISGALAATVVYNSGSRTEGALLELEDVEMTVTGPDMPGMWFGNTVATANLKYVDIYSYSKVLFVANRSIVAPTFDRFAGPEAAASGVTIEPAVVDIYVSNSRLVGDIVALQGSTINLYLSESSTLTGSIYTDNTNATVNIRIQNSARWIMTDRSQVGELRNEDATKQNIITNGFKLQAAATEAF